MHQYITKTHAPLTQFVSPICCPIASTYKCQYNATSYITISTNAKSIKWKSIISIKRRSHSFIVFIQFQRFNNILDAQISISLIADIYTLLPSLRIHFPQHYSEVISRTADYRSWKMNVTLSCI